MARNTSCTRRDMPKRVYNTFLQFFYTRLTVVIVVVMIVVVETGLRRAVALARESELAVFLLVVQQALQLGKHLPTVAAYQYVRVACVNR